MRDHVKTKYTYRERQTRLHRRQLQGRRAIVRKYYLAFLTLLVIANIVYTALIHTQAGKAPTTGVKKVAVQQKRERLNLKFSVFELPNLSHELARKAFAAEATPTLIPQPTSPDSWENFKQEAQAIAKIYGYPSNLLIAQAALESAHGTSSFAINRNNYFGIGAYDATPNSAFQYDNPAQSIIDYIYVIKNNFPEAWNARDDAAQTLSLLEYNDQGAQYASDPSYIQKVMSQPEWSNQ